MADSNEQKHSEKEETKREGAEAIADSETSANQHGDRAGKSLLEDDQTTG